MHPEDPPLNLPGHFLGEGAPPELLYPLLQQGKQSFTVTILRIAQGPILLFLTRAQDAVQTGVTALAPNLPWRREAGTWSKSFPVFHFPEIPMLLFRRSNLRSFYQAVT